MFINTRRALCFSIFPEKKYRGNFRVRKTSNEKVFEIRKINQIQYKYHHTRTHFVDITYSHHDFNFKNFSTIVFVIGFYSTVRKVFNFHSLANLQFFWNLCALFYDRFEIFDIILMFLNYNERISFSSSLYNIDPFTFSFNALNFFFQFTISTKIATALAVRMPLNRVKMLNNDQMRYNSNVFID